jgi:hypothetical protein
MFGFPPILNGNAGIKFTKDADSGFPKPGIREIFYSIKDGNWTDRTVWETASGRVGLLPTANDDVYVRHLVNITGSGLSFNCNNLFISGTLSWLTTISVGSELFVNGNIKSTGTLILRAPSASSARITLLGTDNTISNLTTDSTGIFNYGRNGDQNILDLPYSNLTISGTGTKTLTSNLTVLNNLTVTTALFPQVVTFELLWWDLTVLGTTLASATVAIKKSHFGNVLFVGAVSFANQVLALDFSGGNPNVEFRNGFNIPASNPPLNAIRTGTGIWSFTTNNQTINSFSANFPQTLDCTMIIGSGVTLTNNGGFFLNSTINGTDGTSLLRMGSGGILNFATLASVPSMTTGTWDFTTNANTIGYTGNYSATIPSYFTTFRSLTISGTGTKTLGVNTTLNGNLSTTAGVLQLSTFNLNVLGTSTIGNATTYTLLKSGAGNIVFTGNVNVGHNQISFDFSAGNPNVEFKGGITGLFVNNGFRTGTGTFTFSTNSQTISIGSTNTYDCAILISGAITLTWNTLGIINSTINGNDVNSKLLLATNSSIWFNTLVSTNVMVTGIFDYATNANDIGFTGNYSYTIPSTYTILSTLTIRGTGTKTLSTNTVLNGNLRCGFINASLDGNLELSTYNLTVLGATSISMNGTNYGLTKSGSGNVIFTGLISLNVSNQNSINFSGGNPTVEVKNGISTNASSAATIISGTGQWTFSTNSQSISGNGGIFSLACPILISGNITLTLSVLSYTFTGLINGDNAGSTLRAGTSSPTLNYQNTTQPMATGVLDTSTNLNTFIYGAGNQDVKGNPASGQFQQYRNLTLNGGGNKTLQGNINVQNTYTVTAPAALVLNGFTKTP